MNTKAAIENYLAVLASNEGKETDRIHKLILSLDELALLANKVYYTFDESDYLSTPAEERVAIALKDIEAMPRAGWVKRNVPNPENIKEHTDHITKYAFSEAPAGIDPHHARDIAAVHDIPEAIVTDFTPSSPISEKNKATLEILAVKVIYQSSPKRNEILELVREYQEQKTPESHWVHDVDKLDPLFVALQYEAKYPKQMGLFKEFADYVGSRLKTEKGKELYNDLIENQVSYRQAHRDSSKASALTQRGSWAGR